MKNNIFPALSIKAERTRVPVVWMKVDGPLPERSYQDNGYLMIRNVQPADSGVYACQAQSNECFEKRATITVEG